MIDLIWSSLWEAWETLALFIAGGAAFAFVARERPSWHSLATIGSFCLAIILMSLYDFWKAAPYPDPVSLKGVIEHYESVQLLYEIWGTGMHASALVYVCLALAFAFSPPKHGDAFLCAIISVVVFAETWTAVVENLNCNFIQDDIPAELQTEAQANMSKCERLYGWWYRYMPIIAEICLFLYFTKVWRWARLRAS